MHELSMAEQLLSVVLDHARRAKVRRVTRVDLVLGELAGFLGESLQFYFDHLSKGTEAENASLAISRIQAKARCHWCKAEFYPNEANWLCLSCGGPMEEILAGREFYVESLEVEEWESADPEAERNNLKQGQEQEERADQ
jgi:hydrogenase nickel incorporation protein HypA/HybF